MSIPEDPVPVRPRQTINSRSAETLREQQEDNQKLLKSFERLVQTEDGLFFLQRLYRESCCAENHLLMIQTGEISTNALLAKAGRASLWLDLRKFFTRESLIKIEYPETKGQK